MFVSEHRSHPKFPICGDDVDGAFQIVVRKAFLTEYLANFFTLSLGVIGDVLILDGAQLLALLTLGANPEEVARRHAEAVSK